MLTGTSSGAGAAQPVSAGPTPRAGHIRAVVLCGYGSDLYPLIEQRAGADEQDEEDDSEDGKSTSAAAAAASATEEGEGLDKQQREAKQAPEQHLRASARCKALLPVAGRAMVEHVLDRAELAALTDTLVLAPESLSGALAAHLRNRRANASSAAAAAGGSSQHHIARVETEGVPDKVAEKGAVAVLRWAIERSLIQSDFVVLPCDLLMCPSADKAPSLSSLIDAHRASDSLLTTLFYERAASTLSTDAKQSASNSPDILLAYDDRTGKLIDVREVDDCVDDEDELPMRASMFHRHPRVALTSAFVPAHASVFSHALVPLLRSGSAHDARLRALESLTELVGWAARLAWRRKGRDAVYVDGKPARADSLALADGGAADGTAEVSAVVLDAAQARVKQARRRKREARVVLWRREHGWCGRGNNVAAYAELNKMAVKHIVPTQEPLTNLAQGVQIAPDSWVHPSIGASIGERASVRRSIVHRGVTILRGARLANSVVLDDALIGENVRLENCVVGAGARIGDKAALRDCEIGPDAIVPPDTQAKGEQFVLETIGDDY